MKKNQLYGWKAMRELHELQKNTIDKLEFQKVSVVIPTLNQATTLEHTLLSIINQDYSNYEIIVMDGGSDDGTSDIIHRYQDWIEHYQSGTDGGQSQAINKGFSLATGKIYAWINSDDFYLPGAFAKVVKAFNRKNDIDIVVGAGDILTRDCKFLKHIDSMEMNRTNLVEWHKDKWIMQQSCFWSSRIWERSGGVDESLELLMDFDLWLRFSALGKSLKLDDVLAIMRYYPEAKTVSLRTSVREEEAYVYAKNKELSEVRRVVSELVQKNRELESVVEKYNKSIVRRIGKRLGIED
jgi:glycosyltransferase involved in cell wall biosynthesis